MGSVARRRAAIGVDVEEILYRDVSVPRKVRPGISALGRQCFTPRVVQIKSQILRVLLSQ